MSYDINSMLENNLKAILATSTANLCASLTCNVSTITSDPIIVGNPARVTRQVDQYPAIILNCKNKSQEWDEIGMQSSKTSRQVVVNIDILALTQCASDSSDADRQAVLLARNIENLLESNIERADTTSTVSNGWHNVIVKNTIFDGAYNEKEQTYQAVVKLETEFKSWSVR